MNYNHLHSSKKSSFDNSLYLKNTNIRRSLVLILLLLQFQPEGFSQQNTPDKLPGKIDSVTYSSVNKSPGQSDSVKTYSPAFYPGGDEEFLYHLMRNLRLPENYGQKTDLTIVVTFTISESGKLTNFHASDGPKPFTKEAIRVVKSSGKWIPAYKDGKPISSEFQQKISFKVGQ